MARLGIVTGLKAEAALLARQRNAPFIATVAGSDPLRLRAATEELIAQGADALISFGLAGGLSNEARAGDLIVSAQIISADGLYQGDEAWARRAHASLAGAMTGRVLAEALFSQSRPAATWMEKAQLRERSGAYAVDMESAGIAQAALAAGKPFIAVRAVIDDARRDLPLSAVIAQNREGGIDGQTIAGVLFRQPGEILALIRLGWQGARAFSALRAASGASGGGFFF